MIYLTESLMSPSSSWHRNEHWRYFRLLKSLFTSPSALFHCSGVEGVGLEATIGAGVVRCRAVRRSSSFSRGLDGVDFQDLSLYVWLDFPSEIEYVYLEAGMSVLIRRGISPGILRMSFEG